MSQSKSSKTPVVILSLVALVLAPLWLFSDMPRQNLVLITIMSMMGSVFLLFVWYMIFSGATWKAKGAVAGVALALAVLAFLTLEVRDFSGDIVPKLSFKWTPRSDETLANETQTAAEADLVAIDYAFPKFMGPNGDQSINGLNLSRDWTTPPKEIWRIKIGAGWSGFAVAGNLAVTQEQRGDREMVTAYNLTTGEQVWAHGDDVRFNSSLGGDGPRSTPTLFDGKVYTMGATGLLNCLDLATGAKIWGRDLVAENSGTVPEWGFSSSPLVLDDIVVAPTGGYALLAAFDRESGEPAWKTGGEGVGYSSPNVATIAGVRQILSLNGDSVTGHDPKTGRVLWRDLWGKGTPNVANPLPLPNDQVFVSSGYGVGAKLYQLSESGEDIAAEELYFTPRLKAKFANVAHRDGYIYGLDDGVLTCIDVAEGQRQWKKGRYGHGQIFLVDDLLLVQSEDGVLHLVEASPEKHNELGKV